MVGQPVITDVSLCILLLYLPYFVNVESLAFYTIKHVANKLW